MADCVVGIQNTSVAYRANMVLQDVSLSVQRGEFVGIIGPNGAGKTTLLTLINGIVRLASGTVEVLGMDPHRGSGHAVRKRVGYVAQADKLDPRLPMLVRESVEVGLAGKLGWFRRVTSAHRVQVDEAMHRVGVSHLADRPLGQLSGGEYQRVALARALVQQPEIFLFDEPTAAIDPKSQGEILRLVAETHSRLKATSFYVTHDLSLLPATCTRLVMMKDGRIWRDGLPEHLLVDEILDELYAGTPSRHGCCVVGRR